MSISNFRGFCTSSFAIIFMGKRDRDREREIGKRKGEGGEWIALPHNKCLVTDMWLFLTASFVGLQCVLVVFPDHSHFLTRNSLQ